MLTDLKLKRLKKEMKQIELAKLTGIDRSRLNQIENGWLDAKLEEIEIIKKVLKEKN